MSLRTEPLTTGELYTFKEIAIKAQEAFRAEQWHVAQQRLILSLNFAKAVGIPAPDLMTRVHEDLAIALLKRGKRHLALKIYDQTIYDQTEKDGVKVARLHACKSHVWETLGNREAALQSAEEAIKAAPGDHYAHLAKFVVLLKMGKAEEVLTIIESCTKATDPATWELSCLYRVAKKRAEVLLARQAGAVPIKRVE